MAAPEGAPLHGNPAHLLPPSYKRLITAWLEEDAPSFDYGGFVVGDEMSEARLLGKSKVRDNSDSPSAACKRQDVNVESPLTIRLIRGFWPECPSSRRSFTS
jgi:hypothetical protein